jgi:hypothetical protein
VQYSVLHFTSPYFSVLFSGDPEIIALSEILRVNSCVWEIRHGYAEVIFRHLLTNPIPGTSTVHLHYASRRHYEFTDIRKVKTIKHLPMQTFILTHAKFNWKIHCILCRTLCLLKLSPMIIVDLEDHAALVHSLHKQLVEIA